MPGTKRLRLNSLEAEKIRAMLAAAGVKAAVIINTCCVTAEAGRQSRQQFHKIVRENPNIPIFITGCGATLRPDDFAVQNATVIPNKDKFNLSAYFADGKRCLSVKDTPPSVVSFEKMKKKGFVQIGDGCNWNCTYCITKILRGGAVHFPYEKILMDAKALIDNGYEEIVLTGVNISDWNGEIPLLWRGAAKGGGVVLVDKSNHLAPKTQVSSGHSSTGGEFRLVDLCRQLLNDLPEMKHLTLSSLDPAADIISIIDLIAREPRMTRHLHLSVQSGSDEILQKMARRHNAARIREITEYAHKIGTTPPLRGTPPREGNYTLHCRTQFPSIGGMPRSGGVVSPAKEITFSWDIICGFPGETLELFNETLKLAAECQPIKIHAFPFSARPGTVAATMPNQIPRVESKRRVKILVRLPLEQGRGENLGNLLP